MAAVVYTEFDSTPATIAADVKAAILTQTDWTNPGGGSILKSVTTGGANLVISIPDVAANNRAMGVAFFRDHDGTTGTDKSLPMTINWRAASALTGTTTTDPIHATVAVGKNHLMICLEGARPGEIAIAENPNVRDMLIMSDVVRYRDDDTVPCVVASARTNTVTVATVLQRQIYFSRNRRNLASWTPGMVASMGQLGLTTTENQMIHISDDDKATFFPFLLFDNAEGLRGRMRNFLYGGMNWQPIAGETNQIVPGMKFVIGGATYIVVAPMKVQSNAAYGTAIWQTAGANTHEAPLLLVPFSGDV